MLSVELHGRLPLGLGVVLVLLVDFLDLDSLGVAAIVERLEPLVDLGRRMQPTNLLLEMAESGRKFYDG